MRVHLMPNAYMPEDSDPVLLVPYKVFAELKRQGPGEMAMEFYSTQEELNILNEKPIGNENKEDGNEYENQERDCSRGQTIN